MALKLFTLVIHARTQTRDPIGALVRKVEDESRASLAVKRMKLDGAL